MRQFNDAGFRMALYEQKQIDWNGTKRFFKGMAADPTTYVDLSTLGLVRSRAHQPSKRPRQGLLRPSKPDFQPRQSPPSRAGRVLHSMMPYGKRLPSRLGRKMSLT